MQIREKKKILTILMMGSILNLAGCAVFQHSESSQSAPQPVQKMTTHYRHHKKDQQVVKKSEDGSVEATSSDGIPIENLMQ